jgi:hypothetical protein
VCIFRKGEPSASLKIQESGWVDYSINRPKNWLAISRRREPNKVSIYDIGESKLVSTLQIRTHFARFLESEQAADGLPQLSIAQCLDSYLGMIVSLSVRLM